LSGTPNDDPSYHIIKFHSVTIMDLTEKVSEFATIAFLIMDSS